MIARTNVSFYLRRIVFANLQTRLDSVRRCSNAELNADDAPF
jgi:hypothetical protein